MSDTHDDVAKMWNVEGVDVEDAADRAQRKRKHGVPRIHPREIGFWPGNRGGTSVLNKDAAISATATGELARE